jgi:hypothetical protein
MGRLVRIAKRLSLSCSAPNAAHTVGERDIMVSPEQLQKGTAESSNSLDSISDSDVLKVVKPGGRIPAPSIVIPWVLQEVAASSLFNAGCYKKQAQYEVNAERLLSCWAEHGQAFLASLCPEMFAFLKLHSREGEIRAVAAFLAQLFQGHLEGGNRKGPGGKNMWPAFVAGMAEGAVVQMSGGKVDLGCRAQVLLSHAQCTVGAVMAGDRNGIKLLEALSKAVRDIKEAKVRAVKDGAKAAVKPAPWEVAGISKGVET